MGRKPLSDSRKTETPLRIRLTEAERAELDKAAGGQPVSSWAREVLLKIARKGKKK